MLGDTALHHEFRLEYTMQDNQGTEENTLVQIYQYFSVFHGQMQDTVTISPPYPTLTLHYGYFLTQYHLLIDIEIMYNIC